MFRFRPMKGLGIWLTDGRNRMPHLECDENRRACIRCVTSRQHCGGYAEPAASAPKMPRQPSSTLVGLYYNAAPPDRELFFVLRTVALRSFSGVFDRDFWAIDVVRAAQIYPAVWYAGLALAAAYRGLHGAVQAPNMKSQHDDYALLLYSKCMHSVIGIIGSGELSKADQEAVLLSNILLIGFCCLRRDNTAAFDHMGKGLQVFCSWSFYNKALKPSEQAAVVDARSLTLLFRRFGLQYGSSDRPDARQSRKPVPRTLSNAAFTSATEACYEFLAFQIGISNALAAAGDTDVGSPQPYRLNPDALHAYRMLFSHWENKFRVLIQSPSLQASELEGILTLQIWAAVSRIRLYCQRTDRPGADVAYDEWQPTFQHMAALCEQLYAAITTNTDRMELPYTSLLFSFGLSVCEPLMYAVRCYDGGVRRRIIAFLRKWPRRDGVLDPKLAAAIIEETMLYEEALAIKSKRKGSNVCQCIPIEYVCGGHRVIRNKVRNVREGVSELTLTTEISLEPVELGCCSGKKVLITW